MSDFQFQNQLARLGNVLTRPMVQQRWPDASIRLTLIDAIQSVGDEEAHSLAKNLTEAFAVARAESEILKKPIISVLGELNSGKSSVVASFLSPEGKARLPRGEDNAYGTHRFVYWVPDAWLTDEKLKSAFLKLLEGAHGPQREFLSNDPEKASDQYRSGHHDLEKIAIPLIASDPNLNEFDAAFLDCPDAQTRDRAEQADAKIENPRIEFISQSSLVCSAFLLVWERGKLRDRMLETFLQTIRRRLQRVPLYLLVNKIRPEKGQPARTRSDSDLQHLIDTYQIDGCYGAFDFQIPASGDRPGWNDLTPPTLVERCVASESPQFFLIEPENDQNFPHEVSEDRFLSQLPNRLDAAQLQQNKQIDHWNELQRLTDSGLLKTNEWIESRNEEANRIHQGLLELCTELFTDPGTREPLQVISPEYAEAFAESMIRTAPLIPRTMLKITKPFDKGANWCRNRIKDITSRLGNVSFRDYLTGGKFKQMQQTADRVKKSMTGDSDQSDEANENTQKKFEELGIKGARLTDKKRIAHQMHALRWAPHSIDEECLESAWGEIISNAHRYRLRYDDQDEQFDMETREFWKNAGGWFKIKLAVSSLLKTLGSMAVIGGVAVATVDGGATLATFSLGSHLSGMLGVTALSGTLSGASGLGAAAIAGMGVMGGVYLGAIKDNTLPYLSRYFALACDAFGVPRKLNDADIKVQFGKKGTFECVLPEPRIEKQPTACELADLRLWNADAENICALKQLFQSQQECQTDQHKNEVKSDSRDNSF